MLNLRLLKNKTGTTFNLKSKISSGWKTIGSMLKIEQSILHGWATKYHHDQEECLDEVLNEWLINADDNGSYPLTWKGLYDLLIDSGKRVVAREYFEFLENIS